MTNPKPPLQPGDRVKFDGPVTGWNFFEVRKKAKILSIASSGELQIEFNDGPGKFSGKISTRQITHRIKKKQVAERVERREVFISHEWLDQLDKSPVDYLKCVIWKCAPFDNLVTRLQEIREGEVPVSRESLIKAWNITKGRSGYIHVESLMDQLLKETK